MSAKFEILSGRRDRRAALNHAPWASRTGWLTGSTLALMAGMAHAQETSRASDLVADSETPTETVLVVGRAQGYRAITSTGTTRTPTAIEDIPQIVTIITRELIEDAAINSIADVARFTPGVTIGQGEGNRDQITLRGNNTTANFLVDGYRDDVQYFRPLYNIERVEVLLGANALAFGRGGGGGVINRVTKTPVDDTFLATRLAADTFGSFAAELDTNASFGEAGALRLNSFYETAQNHRDFYGLERFGFNPTLALRLTPRTRFGLSYEYVRDDRTADRGIPSLAGRPIAGFRDTFFGQPDFNRSVFEGNVGKVTIEHEFTPDLVLSSVFVYGDYNKIYSNLFPATSVTTSTAGVPQIGIEAYIDPTNRRNILSQTNLVWRFDSFGADHQVLFGFEAGNQHTTNRRINGFFSGVPTTQSGRRTLVSLPAPVPGARLAMPAIAFPESGPAFLAGNANRSVRTDVDLISAYVQDQISFGSQVHLIVGGRYDRFDLTVDNRFTGQGFARVDDLFSPRAGLVWKPLTALSLYSSFSRSFLPQSGDQFLSLDVTTAALEPERFDNIEAGIKWSIRPELRLSAAVYRLNRSNTREPTGTAGIIALTGEQRSRGFELGLEGQVLPHWNVSAAYTLQEAEITSTTIAAPAGRRIGQVPRHIFNAWNRYDFRKYFGAGIGVFHQSQSFATISNTTILPAFTRADLGLFFRLSPRLEAQVNIENLFNGIYFPTAHTDNNISSGGPRAARFTLKTTF